ncbi:cubilin [Neodiprion pinetum]|uniref:cubilin n=1 Tax=Neodiprion pinetum TaxID=441929 RepID=UPI001EDEDF9C|nr:uncharacterized protein LOC124212292 [Neodiprion pinetum]
MVRTISCTFLGFSVRRLSCRKPIKSNVETGLVFNPKYVITSPKYPSIYPSSQDCVYVLKGSQFAKCEQEFHLQFLDFQLEASTGCVEDYLKIGNGTVYCGNSIGTRKFQGQDNSLKIIFHSGNGTRAKGFRILVTALPCGDSQLSPLTKVSSTTKAAIVDNSAKTSYPVYRPEIEFDEEDEASKDVGRGDQPSPRIHTTTYPTKASSTPSNLPNGLKRPSEHLELPEFEQHDFCDKNCGHVQEAEVSFSSSKPPSITSYLYLPPASIARPLKVTGANTSPNLSSETIPGGTAIRNFEETTTRPSQLAVETTEPSRDFLVHPQKIPLPFTRLGVKPEKRTQSSLSSQSPSQTYETFNRWLTYGVPDSLSPVNPLVPTTSFDPFANNNNNNNNDPGISYNPNLGTNCGDGRSPSFGTGNGNFVPPGSTGFGNNPGVNCIPTTTNCGGNSIPNFGTGNGNFVPTGSNGFGNIPSYYPSNGGNGIPSFYPVTHYPAPSYPGTNVQPYHPSGTNFGNDNGYPDAGNEFDFSFGVNNNNNGNYPSKTPTNGYYYPNGNGNGNGNPFYGTDDTTYFNNGLSECCGSVYSSSNFLLTNPGFPSLIYSSNSYECQYTIQRASQSTCQLRMYFKFFNFGSEDQFCTYGYVEVDGRRLCGCKTGLNVTTSFDNIATKVITVKYLGYPKVKFNGFVIEVTQESCLTNYLRTGSGSAGQEFLLNTNQPVFATNYQRNYKRSASLDGEAERSSDPEKDVEELREKRDLGHTFERTNSAALTTSRNLFFGSCQVFKFLNWVKAAKQVYLRSAQCSSGSTNTGTLSTISVIPIFPDNVNSAIVNFPSSANCETVNVVEGIVSSSYYPNGYSNNLNQCYRFFKAPGYCQLELAILDFDLENSTLCRKDYVTFSGQKKRYCGTSLTGSRTIFDLTQSSFADLYFVTDSSGTGRGFRAGFTQISC